MDLKETEVTRYLCAAAYTDKEFREEAIKQVIKEKYTALALFPGFDLAIVVKHCLLAKRLELSRDVCLALLLVLALLKGFPLSLLCAIAYFDKNFFKKAISIREGFDSQVSQSEKKETQKTTTVKEKQETQETTTFKKYILSVIIFLLTFLYCFPLAYPLAFLIIFVWRWNINYSISRKFSKKHFKKYIDSFCKDHPSLWKEIPKMSNYDTSNVLVYGDRFYPFIGAGLFYNKWSFDFPLRKKRDDVDTTSEPLFGQQEEAISLDLEELYGYVTNKLINLNFDGLIITDKLLLNGQKVRGKAFFSNHLSCPKSCVNDFIIKSFLNQNTHENIRYYKQIQVVIWNGEIVLSIFFRFVKNVNQKLFVETIYFILPPVKEEYQKIDKLYSEVRLKKMSKFLIKSFSDTLFLFPFSLFNIYKFLVEEYWFSRRENSKIKRTIRETANFNYGATKSIREEASVTNWAQYFQVLDTQMYYKMINRQILDSLYEFLESEGIDTSDLKESSKAIFNYGVIVSGNSSFNTQNLAVGDEAQAIINNSGPSEPLGGTSDHSTPPGGKSEK
ncbi:hypothetical protein G7B40_029735 [Aetokthonos hydrillicola Thurmond2011]|jgi:hypothetical protein|uniref:Uncharacterized protein n=1 Tax=Aetokthonos hydrillicola Thurmond2011 TaxID=2712845 RepID=A0AAP5IFJ4_9CYAN|nr:hypothetical protein [Aetokthonos hydrillicola]MBO3461964.1 hypothetical protein [Aetokthonos hydrillicola CCALA 1050]MBW4589150.1 hypothetical protein [Aetokthonos hydrillicola CCALA 1050]MDR9898708.1 hypothetical protein [Aetokthonos hydrillicola Thurmond2011]